jgi:hypothetical protein
VHTESEDVAESGDGLCLRLGRERSLLDRPIRFAEENMVDLIERETGNLYRRLLE